MFLHKGHQGIQRAGQDQRIRVEQDQVFPAAEAHRLVDRAGKTQVLTVIDYLDRRKFALQHFQHAILGTIIDDDNLIIQAGGGSQRVQAVTQHVTNFIRDDANRSRHLGRLGEVSLEGTRR